MTGRGRLVSPIGCLGALLLTLVIVTIVLLSGGSIFSPGPLTAQASGQAELNGFASHADFETDCNQCHVPMQGTTPERCEACHTSVAAERVGAHGLHSKLAPEAAARCDTCHADHRGRDFAPGHAALRTFDHSGTAFSLARHIVTYEQAPLECQGCHAQSDYAFEADACIRCHAAHAATFTVNHVRAFGLPCLECHDGGDRMQGFDHAATDFGLDGQHSSAPCTACHSPAVPASQAPTECAGCHAVPAAHKGVFSTDCAECHSAVAWSPARLDQQADFQHVATEFQLTSHITDYDGSPITCSACHAPGQFTVTQSACADCHAGRDSMFMDQHLSDYGPNCTSCHDGADNMRDFDHNRVFALDGQHAGLACADCHVDQQFDKAAAECSACHREPEIHAGVFGLSCEACHTTTAWTPAQLTRHAFPLDHGGQGEVACATCHTATYVDYTCFGCHDHEEANTQTTHARIDVTGERLNDCVACHSNGAKTATGS
jgi:hypothetical protein